MPCLQYRSFFYRRRVELDDTGAPNFEPIGYPSLDPYLYRPVVAGMWTHSQAVDGTFTFADLMDVHELLDVKAANDLRFHHWQEAQRK